MDFSRSATEIYNRLRGFQPWPGAYTKFRGKNLQLHRIKPIESAFAPAEMHVEGNHLLVGCGQKSSLEIIELQVEGKKRTLSKDFLQGYQPKPGEKLGM